MGPRVKFAVDPEASQKLDKQLISNDLGGLKRIQWMVFKMGNESWDLVAEGGEEADWWKKMISHVKHNEAAHLIFRDTKGTTDTWVKFIPDTAHVKEKTLFSSAGESLFDGIRFPKNRVDIRDIKDLDPSNPDLKNFV